MIFFRILKKDFLRKKGIVLIVFTFIALSAFLMSAGTNLIVELNNSLDTLFTAARVPHFVQMHAGSINRAVLERWAGEQEQVEEFQLVEMITLDGSALSLGETGKSEETSVMDISFVRQNENFDFLLDMENRPFHVSPGEIAVPVYYLQDRDLGKGDTVLIENGSFRKIFTIAGFLRDAQMNPSIVHSKRFLVHPADYGILQEHFTEREYLVEFRLADPDRLDSFSKTYLASNMPKTGPSVDMRLFKTLNALTDGIVAAVVIVLSLLIMLIALLCLRFTLLAGLEEDYREIGVMKAVGMKHGDIRRIYLFKYAAPGLTATIVGYMASLYFYRLLTGDILLYIGGASRTLLLDLVPAAAAAVVFLIVLGSTSLILRRLKGISAVQALRADIGGNLSAEASSGGTSKFSRARRPGKAIKARRPGRRLTVPFLSLEKSRFLDVNIFLGMRDVVQRFRIFALLGFIFFAGTFIIILPVHFLGTIKSPGFISYMGIGRSDIRIDLRHSDSVSERFTEMLEYIEADPEVERFSPLVTSQFTLIRENGEKETMAIESGDFSLFPLDYVEGRAPVRETEIALSYLQAGDLEKKIGHRLTLGVDGSRVPMTVCGIYQDVTNGGRTAKTLLPYNPERVLRYTVSIDLRSKKGLQEKVHEYSERFYPARVTDMESYIAQTLGNTIDQLSRVTFLAIVVGVAVTMLITGLFLKMIISKDSGRIAIMKSLGFTLHHVRIQYLSNILFLLVGGLVAGTLFSNTFGQRLVSLLWSLMGASQISFVINPLRAYILMPLLLMSAVALVTVLSMTALKDHKITEV